jgi:hypothetical protein
MQIGQKQTPLFHLYGIWSPEVTKEISSTNCLDGVTFREQQSLHISEQAHLVWESARGVEVAEHRKRRDKGKIRPQRAGKCGLYSIMLSLMRASSSTEL